MGAEADITRLFPNRRLNNFTTPSLAFARACPRGSGGQAIPAPAGIHRGTGLFLWIPAPARAGQACAGMTACPGEKTACPVLDTGSSRTPIRDRETGKIGNYKKVSKIFKFGIDFANTTPVSGFRQDMNGDIGMPGRKTKLNFS